MMTKKYDARDKFIGKKGSIEILKIPKDRDLEKRIVKEKEREGKSTRLTKISCVFFILFESR